jgi:phosphatidylglycerol:prolipoprotein diacylglycerol transferase
MGFQLGPLTIRYYGIILMVGALAAAWLASIEARRRKQNPELVWDGLVWVLVGGIIGARIWHILTPPQSMAAPPPIGQGLTTSYYLTHPLDALAIWNGGLGIPGAVIGGMLALYWFARNRKLNFAMWADIVAPALALGQAIGRWGNFVNRELYGAPTDLPWGITSNPNDVIRVQLGLTDANMKFHPLFLYESIFNLANMAFLLWLGRRYQSRLKFGDLFLIYLITYPTARFFLEFLRLDTSQVGSLNINQAVMAVVALAAAAALFWRHRRQEKTSAGQMEPDSAGQ